MIIDILMIALFIALVAGHGYAHWKTGKEQAERKATIQDIGCQFDSMEKRLTVLECNHSDLEFWFSPRYCHEYDMIMHCGISWTEAEYFIQCKNCRKIIARFDDKKEWLKAKEDQLAGEICDLQEAIEKEGN